MKSMQVKVEGIPDGASCVERGNNEYKSRCRFTYETQEGWEFKPTHKCLLFDKRLKRAYGGNIPLKCAECVEAEVGKS